jgi:apolipoprotein D and lipocalin family protein
MSLRLALAALAFALGAATAASAAPLDVATHYSGTWLEVGRTPMKLTDGCVAGTTTYTRTDATHVTVVDDCRQGGPDGKRKAVTGKGVIADPADGHLMSVRYFWLLSWRFEIFDHDPAGQWFIAGDLNKANRIFVFTRKIPSPEELADLIARARAVGYAGVIETPRHE